MRTFIPIKNKNIEISPFDKVHFLIRNLSNGKYLRVSSNIAQALEMTDGKKCLGIIYDKIEGKEISIGELYDIYANFLSEYGIILNGKKSIKQKQDSHSYLTFKRTLFKSETVNKISKLLSHLYHPFSFGCVMVTFILAVVFVFFQIPDFVTYSMIQNFDTANFLILILAFFVGLFHEIGHSSALSYFKGYPKEIGIGLYLIFPIFYSSITDSWKVERKNRIIINFGGIYFEIILISIGLLFFLITKKIILILLCILNLVVILYNLNPLIRTDGYWILSDATNTPNLANVSMQRMKLFF